MKKLGVFISRKWRPYASFFQKNWGIVGRDVVGACLSILNGGNSIASWNTTNVCLIPKVKNPKRVSNLRPISLCNVIYKIVTKSLANRLKTVLDEVISPSKSTFVPGRSITDNVIIAFEMMHSIKRKNNGATGWLSLKLDISKAYDRVEWCFLDAMMLKLSFASQWG